MRNVFGAVEAWFRSESSGVVIVVLLVVAALFFVGARLVLRRSNASRIGRAFDFVVFVVLAVVGILFIIGEPFNE
jgi:hypothetical protein